MKTFYSILYCPIRQNTDERISIGLLLSQGENVFFSYSSEKLRVISQLLPKRAYQLLKSNLKTIANTSSDNEGSLIKDFSFFSKEYVTYLSKYTNNLLIFSPPKPIDIEANVDTFKMLFRKYIYELYSEEFNTVPVNLLDNFKHQINPKIQSRVNIDIELNPSHIPNLVVPTKVWFIGKNEVTVTGELFDFGSKHLGTLENKLRSYFFLIQNVYESNRRNAGTFFLIGNEPDKKDSKNHQIWTSIINAPEIKYTPFNEASEVVEDYIETHGVIPFLPNQ